MEIHSDVNSSRTDPIWAIESVEMVTLAGVSLFREMNTTNAIEISQLPAGMYNIIITFTDGSKQIKSFVKS